MYIGNIGHLYDISGLQTFLFDDGHIKQKKALIEGRNV